MNEERIIIEKLKNIFSNSKEIQLAADNGTSLKLKDGTEIIVSGSEIANDAQVYTVDADGNQTPLADGTYTLENDKTFTVVGGKVTDLKDAATDAPAEADNTAMEAPAEEASETPADDAKEEDDVDARLTALEEQVSQITDAVNKLIDMANNATDVAMSTQTKLAEFMAQPVETPVIRQEIKQTAEQARIERFKALANSYK
ncbi:MAG: hypothetical protein BGO69_15870 [Bacteroidetes bacterium 46-16]|nr:MAG: hypothetical protein BGO69_15870 [Bacteroidetes bacterium 46-16]